MLGNLKSDDLFAGAPADKSRLLRISQVCDATGLSRSYILRLVKEGKFPQPVRPTANAPYWVEGEIRDWQAQLRATRGETPAPPPPAAPPPPDEPPAKRPRGRPRMARPRSNA